MRQHAFAAVGAVAALVLYGYDVREGKSTVASVLAVVCVLGFFFLDTVINEVRSHAETLDRLKGVHEAIAANTENLHKFERVLRSHEHILLNRTIDQVTLVAFNNLLAYLPFYLAQDLGYFADEHIDVSQSLSSLDDATTADLLSQHARGAIALCDPYMCVVNPDLQMVYPVCQGVAAWPMTLNWIGTAEVARKPVRIAAYKSPSTTHVLAQLVSQKVITPVLSGASAKAEVVELADDEADLGADRARIRERLAAILTKYEVTMLWEPYCTEAQSLGARYVEKSGYEKSLKDLAFPPIYSAVVLSRTMINANPTLPLRLRRALDRAVARLRDDARLSFCANTLNIRGLLAGNTDVVRSNVLSRLVASMPMPADDGWTDATIDWGRGLWATIQLRQILIHNQGDLAQRLGGNPSAYSSANDCRRHIFQEMARG